MRRLPAAATVNVRGHGQVPCVVEKETRARYWVRWSVDVTVPVSPDLENPRPSQLRLVIAQGETQLVPKGAVTFEEASP